MARDHKALSLLYEGRADLWVSSVFTAESGAETAGVPVPELTFLWRPMTLFVACSQATDETLVDTLNAVNGELDDLRKKLKQEHY